MGDFNKILAAGLSTDGVTKKDGKQGENLNHDEGIAVNGFHKKIIETRIKQDNWRWFWKEVIICIIGAFVVYVLISSK